MDRLQPETLHQLDEHIARPGYDLAAVQPGIVHLGLGAFHRSHMAMYTDKAIAVSGGNWRIVGVSMRSAEVAQRLRPQGCLYSVMSEDAQGARLRVIGAISEVLVAPDDPVAVAARIADDSTRIVSLTITEKGYALAADGKSLDAYNDSVAADLQHPDYPSSALGLLALGLKKRFLGGGAPLTIMSCDNLNQNSKVLRGVLSQYLQQAAPEVVPWLESAVTFPCTMVDRIVPASDAAQRQRQSEALGLVDEAAICTEPFHQWFIENDFATARPDWEAAGAQIVYDVEPYERIKLGLLNAAHSAIAHYGSLAGLDTVDAVMSQPDWRRLVEALIDEDLVPALTVPSGFDIHAYRDALLERFANPVLGHRCAQIAQDSSDKIAQRWQPLLSHGSIHERPPHVLRALAAWVFVILYTEVAIVDDKAAVLNALRSKPGALRMRIVSILETARITATSVHDFTGCCAVIEEYVTHMRSEGVQALLHDRSLDNRSLDNRSLDNQPRHI